MMVSSVALLSNINVDPIARVLTKSGVEVWTPNGYGDVFGVLLSDARRIGRIASNGVFIIVDLSEVLLGCRCRMDVENAIELWFDALSSAENLGVDLFVSDAFCRNSPYYGDWKDDPSSRAEMLWNEKLDSYVKSHANSYRFPLASIANTIGRDDFVSDKMWYLARVPFTAVAITRIAEAIGDMIPCGKKVLLLDLDNTLWGGTVGEEGPLGIELSDEHLGLAYKDAQREILKAKDAGALLCVVSKNNSDDAMGPFRMNAHMVLAESDIVSFKVGWGRKDTSVTELAGELGLGLDSMVFLDDSPTERELMRAMLPEVHVLEFPDDPSLLPKMLRKELPYLFGVRMLTCEDRKKSELYAAEAKRSNAKRTALTYETYLESLEMKASRVDVSAHIARVAQLVEKTNQFNLTTRRRSQAELQNMSMCFDEWLFYAYDLRDKYADNGLTALAVVDLRHDVPNIDTLILSCRVMGKSVEDFLVDMVESDLVARGYRVLEAEYIPTMKNAPAKDLYERLGYERKSRSESGSEIYRIVLNERPIRKYWIEEAIS